MPKNPKEDEIHNYALVMVVFVTTIVIIKHELSIIKLKISTPQRGSKTFGQLVFDAVLLQVSRGCVLAD